MAGEIVSNVFVIGLDDFQRGQLETVTNAESLAFHRLLPPELVTRPDQRFQDLLDRARGELDAFDGDVHAIITHWDFPTSVLAPILCRERGLPSASLEAVLTCEHKYWSRCEQRASVSEVAPAFAGFDPFDDDALTGIELDHPAEFMYDEEADQLWLLEVNTRISQSQADLFAKVDGMSNHEVALDIAFGSPPSMPEGRGNFAVAAKCFLWTEEVTDGIVRGVPSDERIAEVTERFPGTHVSLAVDVGDRLSELADQSSYRYDVGTLMIGAQSREELVDRYRTCRELLTFDVEPLEP